MPSTPYSFIDVAILDGVRERFAAGDAVVILSADLDELIWANGPGALLFGHADIEGVGGAESGLSYAAKRQVMSTSGYPQIGSDRGVVVRLARGMESRAYAFLASAITLPDGEDAILLAVPAGNDVADLEVARGAIGGFAEPGHHAAFVDGFGTIEAASPGFEALGIAARTLADLASEVARSSRRLVKRVIHADTKRLPAGMARLRDTPARHLLVVIDESAGGIAGATAQPTRIDQAPPAVPTVESMAPPAANPSAHVVADASHAAASAVERAAPPTEPPAQDVAVAAPQAQLADTVIASGDPVAVAEMFEFDHLAGDETVEADLAPDVDRAASPLRFVWRTDASGRFSALSPEFATAVGAKLDAILGHSFAEVSGSLDLDPYGEIAGLLQRRDTWSGRSVLWPITGTDLRVPVDLAALPVYARDRSFEGFRGFGVARMGDAVVDSERPGARHALQLHTGEDEAVGDPFQGETPVLSITPQPQRRFTDKVIKLAEHRTAQPEKALSQIERTAFREIGERLRGNGKSDSETAESGHLDDAPDVNVDESHETSAEAARPEPARPDEGHDIAHEDAAPVPAAEVEHPAPAPAGHEPPAAAASEPPAMPPRRLASETPPAIVGPYAVQHEPARRAPAPQQNAASVDLKTDGFLPSAFSGLAAPAGKPLQDTPILSRLPVPLLIHSGDVLHYANEEFLALTGYGSVGELDEAGGLGALFSEPYDGSGNQDGADRAIRLTTRDGLEFAIEALLRSVPWNGGKALMLVVRRTGEDDDIVEAPAEPSRPPEQPEAALAAAVDVAALKARIAEMRTIIDTATDGVILIANDGTIRSISRPAEALFAFDTDEVVGKPFAALFAIESQRSARDYLAGLADNGVASVLNDGREVIGREAQGRFIPLFMTIGKLPGESGFCAVVRDITQWKRAEEELTQAKALAERSSSQKTDFLARVSHEIRTPLNAIIGFSELMVDERFGPIANDRYRDYLRDINRSGNHVLDLVNDLLDISKIEAGEQEMAYEAVSLNDTLGETVAMMQPQANRERVIIRSSFASRLPEVVADLRSVRQIALNILSNAVRYTQAGGQVIISTAYETSGDVIMRVRDTGIGMSAAEIEQAMKPFKQINSLKRARGDGTGLGLPLTKAMVEANRARFTINSTPGEGTLVEITFPSTRVLAQ